MIGNASNSCFGRLLLFTVVSTLYLPLSGQQPDKVKGQITDRNGVPIPDTTIITSGLGLRGWAISGPGGYFELPSTGSFISFRHSDYRPLLIRSADLSSDGHIALEPIDDTTRRIEPCQPPGRGGVRVGGGFQIIVHGKYKGPVRGEHDTHWWVRRGKDWLHIGEGPFWHSGLPSDTLLDQSEDIKARSWKANRDLGFDISGRHRNGKYWRWLSAAWGAEIDYRTSNRETADYFDKLIATMCTNHE